jgi:tetratricopeptide (TPR) repeat protein
MRRKSLRWVGCVALLAACCIGVGEGQQAGSGAPAAAPQSGPNPLAVGLAALQKGDYGAAKTFFTEYLSSSPDDAEAWLYLGGADLGLKDFPAAIKDMRAVIAVKPDLWPAHLNLVLAYAESEDWADFDKERALIKAARDNNAPGLDKQKGDVIDVLHVGTKTYSVRAFYELYGQFHTRYVFLHFGDDGKLSDYVQCESDDSDQGFFKQAHPKEAAAGARSFSLDSYAVGEKGMTQALIKFYSDGEPTYETVRADALKVLAGQQKPAATAGPSSK